MAPDIELTGASSGNVISSAPLAAVDVAVRDGFAYDLLERHEFVRPLISTGIDEARRIFGRSCTAFAIEVYEDPSGGDDMQIFVLIRTALDADAARVLLERFDNEWWLANMRNAQGMLAFALEFA